MSSTQSPTQNSIVHFNSLPEKLIVEIFTHLDTTTFLRACAVCTHWSKIINTHILFFESWFAEDNDDDDNEDEPEKIKTFINDNGAEYTEEQLILVNQINSIQDVQQYYDLLGVNTNVKDSDDSDIKNQFRKLSLMLHPDKNKAPGASKAFQTLKKAFDTLMSGGVFEDADAVEIKCPSCTIMIKIHKERNQLIQQGRDACTCNSCKKEFGQIFCSHCYSSWMVVLEQSRKGQLVACSMCNMYFALQYPVALPLPFIPSKKPPPPPPTKKKRKKANWWDPQPTKKALK
jgi:hypothetical protein